MKETKISQADERVVDKKTLFWNRVQLILIFVVFTAPIAGAFLYKPTGFTNYGDIYSPVRPVDNLLLHGEGNQLELDSMRRQWIMFVTANGECSSACEENLLKIRQLRFMQNNDMVRIRTLFIHTGLADSTAQDLDAKYQPMETYAADSAELHKWSGVLKLDNAPIEAQTDRIYIIDPAGNLMMSYPAAAKPEQINKDIRRLLKTSQIG